MALGLKPDGSREVLGFWLFGAEGESSHNWETILKELWERGIRRVKLFVSDDLPGIEEAVRRIFPQATWRLCVVHAVRDILSKVREDDWDEPIWRYLYTTNQLERLMREVKRQVKTVGIFCDPEALEKLLYFWC